VAGDNFLILRGGQSQSRRFPGLLRRLRDGDAASGYLHDLERGRKTPDVIFEFTSRKLRKEDTEKKYRVYEQGLQVPEYFLFDPTGDYLKPRLRGYRLAEGRYQPLLPVEGRLHSEQLGLDLVEEGEMLRLYDPQRQEPLLTPLEQAERLEQQAAEIARLRAEIERLRAP